MKKKKRSTKELAVAEQGKRVVQERSARDHKTQREAARVQLEWELGKYV